MANFNFNGQNGVATSAVTSVMASAFAAEMDSILAKATSTHKNFPVMNFLCNVKIGTKKEMPLITENETFNGIKRNMLVTLLAPFGTATIKGWVYQVNGKVQADSVVWLLESAINHIEKFEKHINDYKAGATNFTKKFIEVVEQYGVADIERRIAEMHQYFADLAGVKEQVENNAPCLDNEQENEQVVEQEISNAPCLDNEQVVEQEQVVETRNSAVANIFSNVTVKQVAEKFIKKLRKAESFDEGKRNVCTEIQIKSSDTFRVTIDGGFNENNGKYWCNIHIEEKMGNRFVHFSESNNLRGNEGVWCKALSALYCGIIDEIAVMIDYELSRWEKEINREKINGTNFGYAIHKWETITGCEYVEVEDCAENNEGVTSLDMDSSVAVVEQEISNAPSLDNEQEQENEQDIDIAVDRVVNTIEKYLSNYTPSYLDQFGDCVITVYWDYFSENDMNLLIKDSIFALSVRDTLYEKGVIENLNDFLVYDDGVYVTVDYDKMFKRDSSDSLVDYLHDLDSRPAWVNRNDYNFKDCGDYLDIVMFGSYHIGLYYDPSDSNADFACAENGGAYGKADMEYVIEIMENRDKILALAKNAKIVEKTLEEIVENALESAMDSGEEYYDNVICQIGKWFVNYTSPCKEFPEGCVCVVDSEGRMYGNWCNVSDSGFAVEYLVNTIEKCNKEFNNVA